MSEPSRGGRSRRRRLVNKAAGAGTQESSGASNAGSPIDRSDPFDLPSAVAEQPFGADLSLSGDELEPVLVKPTPPVKSAPETPPVKSTPEAPPVKSAPETPPVKPASSKKRKKKKTSVPWSPPSGVSPSAAATPESLAPPEAPPQAVVSATLDDYVPDESADPIDDFDDDDFEYVVKKGPSAALVIGLGAVALLILGVGLLAVMSMGRGEPDEPPPEEVVVAQPVEPSPEKEEVVEEAPPEEVQPEEVEEPVKHVKHKAAATTPKPVKTTPKETTAPAVKAPAEPVFEMVVPTKAPVSTKKKKKKRRKKR